MWMSRSGGVWEVGSPIGGRGRLRVYLGTAAGVGKTYAMLAEARSLAGSGVDVVVGLVETHDRGDTERMLDALEQVPRRQVGYRGSTFGELDVGAVLNRRPAAVVVDELAHTCVPGSRHEKRWEDVEELLDAGIDVITSMNVQHLDSLNDSVESLTGVLERETVPDAVVAAADRVEFIEVSPQLLRERIADTDVLGSGATADVALSGFFTPDRLTALRALALGWLGQHDLLDPVANPVADDTTAVRVRPERIVVALTGEPEGEHVLRRAGLIAAAIRAVLIGVYVHEPSGLAEAEPAWLAGQRQLLSELGGHYVELAGMIDVATAVLDFARTEDARQLVLGATRRSPVQELLHGSVINKAIRTAGSIEVSVIPPLRRVAHVSGAKALRRRRPGGSRSPPRAARQHGLWPWLGRWSSRSGWSRCGRRWALPGRCCVRCSAWSGLPCSAGYVPRYWPPACLSWLRTTFTRRPCTASRSRVWWIWSP